MERADGGATQVFVRKLTAVAQEAQEGERIEKIENDVPVLGDHRDIVNGFKCEEE